MRWPRPCRARKTTLRPAEFAGEQIVRGRAKGRFDLDPFLVGESLEVVKAGAADDADAMFRHARIFNRETRERHEKSDRGCSRNNHSETIPLQEPG